MKKTYVVDGMTCAHCVNAVSSEIRKVHGVVAVNVDLTTKLVEVDGEEFTDQEIFEAVDEAGYEAALV